jgi:chromate transporter
MNHPSPTVSLTAHLAVLSLVSFGGIPTVLPDLHNFVVTTNGWVSDRDFANFFAVVQSVPGPNMILMMSFIGWSAGGLLGAVACGIATFGPSCTAVFLVHSTWDRFRATPWQRTVRQGLAPVTIGLVIAGGIAMAGASTTGWPTMAITTAAAILVLSTRLSPLWVLVAGGALGGFGIL